MGLLLVLGDHGQTDGGDHPALFAAAVSSGQQKEDVVVELVDDDESVPQIDLAPTLARLAGRTPSLAQLPR